jgi:hypothetical protein
MGPELLQDGGKVLPDDPTGIDLDARDMRPFV